MLITPNHAEDYRNWAYCCARIHVLFKKLDSYSAGKVTNIGEHYKIQSSGRRAYNEYCLKRCHRIARRLFRYTKLRDKIASRLDSPEKHLLQAENMLNIIGNVIEVPQRRGTEKSFCVLKECSSDGSRINGFDAYDLFVIRIRQIKLAEHPKIKRTENKRYQHHRFLQSKTKVASLHLFSGHFAVVLEKKSFCLSRKVFSVSKNKQKQRYFREITKQ